ncbi:MAG: COG1361 S-layer family protein [Nanoarchaeota archaeon]|nr:COG1361 S-layer family protein [Nanoarchaeota archaeon]
MKKISILVVLFCIMIFSVYAAALNDASAITALSVSLVNQDPDPATAGDVVEIRLGLENMGGNAAENLVFELMPSYPFEIISGEDTVKKVGTIGAYQYSDNMKIIKYKIRVNKDATAGAYELKIKYYKEGSTSTITKSLSVDIENKESAEVIYIDQVELVPGKITPMKFTINNVGSAPLRDLTFQWENEDDIVLPVGSDNTKYIKYIDIGDSADLKFNVIASANADPDLYKLDLTLTYSNPSTGEDTEINTKAGIYVGGATDFDVAFSGSSNGEYSFAISNIGSVSASSVTVRILNQEGWKVRGSNSVIIGNLNKGDYTIASFNMQQTGQFTPGQRSTRDTSIPRDTSTAQQAMQDSPIKLEIVYTDSRGNRNTIEKEVPVDVSSFMAGTEGDIASMIAARRARQNPWSQVWNTGKWIILGIVLLVILVLARKKHKKGKLKDPDYTYADTLKDVFAKFKKKPKK